MTTTNPKHPKEQTSRIASRLLKMSDDKAVVLPSDKWVMDNVKTFLKTNKPAGNRIKALAGCAILALGGLATVAVGGITGTLAVSGMILAGSAAVAGISIGAKIAHDFKKKSLPLMSTELRNKYLKLKYDEVRNAWQQRAEEIKQRKQAEAEKAAAEDARQKQEAERQRQEREANSLRNKGKTFLKNIFDKKNKPAQDNTPENANENTTENTAENTVAKPESQNTPKPPQTG